MECVKIGSKVDWFQRKGQAWFCTTGLPSDVTVEVGELTFHLHKFPLLSKCGLLEKLIQEKSDEGEEGSVIELSDIPGGPKAFELVAKFCYGIKLEVTASNVVHLCCAAHHLEMSEEIAEGNLITQTEVFLNQAVLRSWKGTIKALQTCDPVLPHAEDLQIVKKCIDSLAVNASKDPGLIAEHGPMQNACGSILWNGISTGARPQLSSSDWWYEDVSSLSLPMYKRLISVMESRGIRQEVISGSVTFYAKRHLPGLDRRQSISESSVRLEPRALTGPPTVEEQKHLLEEIDRLLPSQKGLVSTKLLFGLLRTAMILRASPSCIADLERKVGMQLDQASLEDLLIPNFSDSVETLYDVDCIHRIVEHFFSRNPITGRASPDIADEDQFWASPSLIPMTKVANLVDGYLAEVASDANLKTSNFQSLAATIPEDVRPLDDGLYRAIDMYLEAHPWLTKSERKELCRVMNCQKLSPEACTHVAKNERLPLRVVVQVLFFELLLLKKQIARCFPASDDIDASRSLRSSLPISGEGGVWASVVRENQVPKLSMDIILQLVAELKMECSSMREELEGHSKVKSGCSAGETKFGPNDKSQICSSHEDVISQERNTPQKLEKEQEKITKYRKQLSKNMKRFL